MLASIVEISGKNRTVIAKRTFTPENAHVVLKACDIVAWKHTQDFHSVKTNFLDNGNVIITLTVN